MHGAHTAHGRLGPAARRPFLYTSCKKCQRVLLVAHPKASLASAATQHGIEWRQQKSTRYSTCHLPTRSMVACSMPLSVNSLACRLLFWFFFLVTPRPRLVDLATRIRPRGCDALLCVRQWKCCTVWGDWFGVTGSPLHTGGKGRFCPLSTFGFKNLILNPSFVVCRQ